MIERDMVTDGRNLIKGDACERSQILRANFMRLRERGGFSESVGTRNIKVRFK